MFFFTKKMCVKFVFSHFSSFYFTFPYYFEPISLENRNFESCLNDPSDSEIDRSHGSDFEIDRSTSMTSRNRQFPTFESFSFTFPYCFDSIWSKITENAWFQKWSIGSKWSNFVISFNSWDILRLFWAKMVKNACFQKRSRFEII